MSKPDMDKGKHTAGEDLLSSNGTYEYKRLNSNQKLKTQLHAAKEGMTFWKKEYHKTREKLESAAEAFVDTNVDDFKESWARELRINHRLQIGVMFGLIIASFFAGVAV
jgi:hypothetical protein